MAKKRPILWKVVQRKTRYSCIIPGFSPLSIKYDKGKEVKSLPGTMGILAFKTEMQAEEFKSKQKFYNGKDLIKIRIQPTSRVKRINQIFTLFHGHKANLWDNLQEYYNKSIRNRKDCNHSPAPHGTVSCKSAIVLD